mmetsp:Transcript_22381/g.55413  ORF Transcript_22381/g.55413 Transcript_22381/m.55413 type:complete len:216 (+) Transcript_22381:623-1270(+)
MTSRLQQRPALARRAKSLARTRSFATPAALSSAPLKITSSPRAPTFMPRWSWCADTITASARSSGAAIAASRMSGAGMLRRRSAMEIPSAVTASHACLAAFSLCASARRGTRATMFFPRSSLRSNFSATVIVTGSLPFGSTSGRTLNPGAAASANSASMPAGVPPTAATAGKPRACASRAEPRRVPRSKSGGGGSAVPSPRASGSSRSMSVSTAA